MKSTRGPILLLILIGTLFVAGLTHLFQLRFEGGDVYPPYSTLRADPLGAKAFYESLDGLIPARRNFQPLTRLGDGRDTTLLYLGADIDEARFHREQLRTFESFLRTGGRLVFAFQPSFRPQRLNRFVTPGPGGGTAGGKTQGTNAAPTGARTGGARGAATNAPTLPKGPGVTPIPNDPLADPDTEPLYRHWDLTPGYVSLAKGADGSYGSIPVTLQAPLELPTNGTVRTALHFQPEHPDWTVVYASNDGTNRHAVLLERRFGKGSLVICADAYPFSNEALRKDPQAPLLSWLVGSSRQVVVDETHLGTSDDPGLAALARRYRLHGLAIALVVLSALFIWRNAASFLPAREETLSREAAHEVAGKDSAEGFVNLLRRNIPPAELMRACLEQWNLAAAARPPAQWKLDAMQQLVDEQNALEPRRRDPVGTYRKFCQILAQRT